MSIESSNLAPAVPAVSLSESEATLLAAELKLQLRSGERLDGDRNQIEKMVAGLGDPRGLMRLTFAESLGSVGTAAVPSLCRALRRHENVTVRRAAAKTLTLIGDPSAIPDLLEALLNDADPVVQGSAVGAMAATGECAVEALINVLASPESTTMHLGLASWGLAFVGAQAPDALRRAARSTHTEVRTAAIAALGDQIQSLNDQEARDLVVEALADSAELVRAEAATLLGKLHEPLWAAPLLTPMLADSSAQVRKNTALALMKLGAVEAIADLEQAAPLETCESVKPILQLAILQLRRHQAEADGDAAG
ncbi:HEAT repeat domain-containing protein [Cyanobium sp. HWJ4-Hawea]|uniref:HEAT repeat domain-containing protein n=1 Tax=Cyanobium sp. HWJ4-Hawea TaxID=2823713 RepID=UPI0020CF36C6|nr:HEAT repeat domain-containing protein [Cyanobium sp. HWJ4-Hawea]MCP9809496.1 HEAT repeat domain-containing protein [Cyanobium sp. HWJ4-Hawea]